MTYLINYSRKNRNAVMLVTIYTCREDAEPPEALEHFVQSQSQSRLKSTGFDYEIKFQEKGNAKRDTRKRRNTHIPC